MSTNEKNDAVAKRATRALVGNYRPQPIALVRGKGCELFDADGTRYLDMMGGIATTCLGCITNPLRVRFRRSIPMKYLGEKTTPATRARPGAVCWTREVHRYRRGLPPDD